MIQAGNTAHDYDVLKLVCYWDKTMDHIFVKC
jgi:hypothetical protein